MADKKKEVPEAIVLELRLQGVIGVKNGKGVKQRFVIPSDEKGQPLIYELEFSRKSFSLAYDWVANQVSGLQQNINKSIAKPKRKVEEEDEEEIDLQELIDEGEEIEEDEDDGGDEEPEENVVRLPSNRADRRRKKKKA